MTIYVTITIHPLSEVSSCIYTVYFMGYQEETNGQKNNRNFNDIFHPNFP